MTTLYWLGLAIMLLASLAFLLPPLVRRGDIKLVDRDQTNVDIYREKLNDLEADFAAGALDQSQFDAAATELKRRLLADTRQSSGRGLHGGGRAAAAVLGLVVPVAAAAIYAVIGTPDAVLDPPPARSDAHAQGQADGGMPPIADLAVKLEARLKADPDNPDGWVMLGKTYGVLGRLDDALRAYGEGRKRHADDPEILVGIAEITARKNDNRFGPAADKLLAEALSVEPTHRKGLWLSGVSAFQKQNGALAVANWERLKSAHDLSPQDLKSVNAFIAEARQMAGLPPAVEAPVAAAGGAAQQADATPPAAGAGAAIAVSVSLDPAFRAQVQGDETLFIYARAETGPPMPLAIARHTVAELPINVTLTDAMAMMPQMKLSNFPSVVVGARISRSGQAIAQPGDLEALSDPTSPKAGAPVSLSINRIVR